MGENEEKILLIEAAYKDIRDAATFLLGPQFVLKIARLQFRVYDKRPSPLELLNIGSASTSLPDGLETAVFWASLAAYLAALAMVLAARPALSPPDLPAP